MPAVVCVFIGQPVVRAAIVRVREQGYAFAYAQDEGQDVVATVEQIGRLPGGAPVAVLRAHLGLSEEYPLEQGEEQGQDKGFAKHEFLQFGLETLKVLETFRVFIVLP